MNLENNAQVEIITLDTIARKRGIPPSFFAIAILLFFFNFCEMSCQGQRIAAISGFQLATGTTIEPPKMGDFFGGGDNREEDSKKVPGNIWAILALLAAAAGLGIYLIGNDHENLVGTIAGGVGALSLLLLKASVSTSIGAEGAGLIVISFLFAYWAAFLSLAAGGAVSAYRFFQKIGRVPGRAAAIPFSPSTGAQPTFGKGTYSIGADFKPTIPVQEIPAKEHFTPPSNPPQEPSFFIPPPQEVPVAESEKPLSAPEPPEPAQTSVPETPVLSNPVPERPPVVAEQVPSPPVPPPPVVQKTTMGSTSQHWNAPQPPYFGMEQTPPRRNYSQTLLIGLVVAAVLLIVAATIVMETGLLSDKASATDSSKTAKEQSGKSIAAGTEPKVSNSGSANNADVTIGYIKTKHGSDVRMRATPSESGEILMKISNGSAVIILGYDDHASMVDGQLGKWCRVKHNGKVGWVWDRFIAEKQGE